jgi:serine/threonine protein kinase
MVAPRVRKTLVVEPGGSSGAAKLRKEYAMLRELFAQDVPNLARPLALEDTGELPALVLEDAGPQDLAQWLRHRPLGIDTFLDLAIRLTEIVASLHRQNVIHGDINPANVVVSADGQRLTLVDFGLAPHVVGLCADRSALELAGTLPYIAPEQTGRMDRLVDHRADLYSLGATLYEMLSGAPPFLSADAAELVHAHLARTPTPLHEANPLVPEALSAVVLKLLAKMPEQR